MRLTKIEFHGYKRLASTSCNVDGRLIAVLGPNEAGKSSVLEGLEWLSDFDSGPLPGRLRSRALGPLSDDQPVVTAQFALDDDDRAALADLDTDVEPRYYRLVKLADGSYQAGTEPRITRRTKAVQDAALALATFVQAQGGGLPTDDGAGPGDWLVAVVAAMEHADDPVDTETVDAFDELAAWLRQPMPSDELVDGEVVTGVTAGDARTADLLDAALGKLREPDVAAQARERLGARRPKFLLFEEPDRVLDSTYDLSSTAVHSDVPPALTNLLRLADTTFAGMRDVQRTGDTTRIQSLLKRCNRLLRERLEPTWGQSRMTVHLGINGDLLQILVDEVDPDGATTDIAERSDGLRTFIALVCFLADKETDTSVAPVLMIDEAETHLHYDAQADLLDVLLNHVKTSKVIYTTHSPGCLPPDLGTGIRLVAPDPGNRAASVLKANFWSSKQPGFSPLLFAMGASAAAFSVCRRAVLAEGASDMILLPSLIRAATGQTELGYQVAPGLATRTSDLSDADVAARVVYLADGDRAGTEYRKALLAEGVDPSRVHLLPQDQAVEDLLHIDGYLAAVRTLMSDGGYAGKPVSARDLRGQGPVASRLKRWCVRHGHPLPGKTAVASHLVQDPARITLADGAAAVLQDLHRDFTASLGA